MSFLIAVVYGVFINGINYSSKAKDTVSIQQEANYFLTVLKEVHEKNNSYKVQVDKDHTTVIINKGTPKENIIESPDFLYQICDLDNASKSCEEQYASDFSKVINNTNRENFHVKMILINKNNPNVTYEVQTILSMICR